MFKPVRVGFKEKQQIHHDPSRKKKVESPSHLPQLSHSVPVVSSLWCTVLYYTVSLEALWCLEARCSHCDVPQFHNSSTPNHSKTTIVRFHISFTAAEWRVHHTKGTAVTCHRSGCFPKGWSGGHFGPLLAQVAHKSQVSKTCNMYQITSSGSEHWVQLNVTGHLRCYSH